jgi:hypothetical protein
MTNVSNAPLALDVAPRHCPHRIFQFIAAIRRERTEIMPPHEQLCRRTHDLEIERRGMCQALRAQQGIHRRMTPDIVAILFAGGVEARVKLSAASERAVSTRMSAGNRS